MGASQRAMQGFPCSGHMLQVPGAHQHQLERRFISEPTERVNCLLHAHTYCDPHYASIHPSISQRMPINVCRWHRGCTGVSERVVMPAQGMGVGNGMLQVQ